MDNLRFKRHNRRPDFGAIDGFVRHNRPEQGSIGFSHRQAKAQPSRPDIGKFERTEGFHAAIQPTIATTSALDGTAVLDQPVLDEPVARPHRKRRLWRRKRQSAHARPTWRKFALRGAAVLSVFVILTGGYIITKGILKARQVLKGGSAGAAALQENVDPSQLKGEGDGRVNILFLGKGGTGHTAPDLTDTILIASIDPVQKDAAILSIPRDLYVKVPNYGSMKINGAYAAAKNSYLGKHAKDKDVAEQAEKAGLESIENTLETTLGIPIHYYAMIDFDGFKQAIDAVGGVDVNVTTSVYEVMYINGRNYVLDVKKGKQHFDGFRALAYSRSRHSTPRGDFDRSARQREIIVALKEKIFSLGTFGNPVKISQLLDAFGDHIRTNLSLGELMRLYEIGKGIEANKISSIGLADPPNNFVTTGQINGLSVVVPRAGVDNFKDIQNFVRNALRDSYLKKEDASIAVYNGTSTNGLAASKAEELKSFGYNITTVANAPTKNYPKTVVVDLRGGAKKYTQHYLEQRFKTTAVTSIPDSNIPAGNADFVIILGNSDASTP